MATHINQEEKQRKPVSVEVHGNFPVDFVEQGFNAGLLLKERWISEKSPQKYECISQGSKLQMTAVISDK